MPERGESANKYKYQVPKSTNGDTNITAMPESGEERVSKYQT